MDKKTFNEKQYKEDLDKYTKSLCAYAQMANHVINISMLMAFHEIGEDLCKKGIWQKEYIRRMSKEYPKHPFTFSEENIINMCLFSSLIKMEEIFSLELFEMSWSDLVPIINLAVDHDDFVTLLKEEQNKGEA